MTWLNMGAIAVALSIDAFAVAVAAGVSLKKVDFRQNFRLSWHFGLFQAAMPVIGWSFGRSIHATIEKFDHWVAFCLLALIGINMLRTAFGNEGQAVQKKDPTRGLSLVLLSVATSIDALAVGLSLAMLSVSIWKPALVIGIIAAAFTLAGLRIGEKLGSFSRLTNYAEGIGGLVLLFIGFRILYVHGSLAFFAGLF
ncbi:MAG: manganese efflux pump MntP family protein [Desulfobacterales bacterium]|nr:manganese efflux pump MntP family protein [Desulfobacterales bacterium]